MKTKEIQELYQIKLHSMDTILHQISLMDQVENEQELSEIIHSLLHHQEPFSTVPYFSDFPSHIQDVRQHQTAV